MGEISDSRGINQIKNKYKCNNAYSNSKKCNQIFRDIENLLEKEYIAEIENIQRMKDFKKTKNIGQNNKQFI